MLGKLQTYSLEDFLPFSREIFLRLFERLHQAVFPWQILALMAGILLIIFCWKKKRRSAFLLLAGAWISVGFIFHIHFFSELVWAAHEFAYGFFAQSVLLVWFAFQKNRVQHTANPVRIIGYLLLILAVVLYPLLSLLQQHTLDYAEVFALMPDPTVIATVGALCVFLQKNPLWYVIPLLWGLVSAAIGKVLDHYNGFSILLVFCLILGAVLVTFLESRHKLCISK